MASMAIERGFGCPLQRAANDVGVQWPERFCFGEATRPAVARAHVLVVDAEVHLAALTARMLVDLGCDARWCLDGRDALDRLAHGYQADLLLVPDDARDLARSAQLLCPGLQVLFIHGSASRGTAPPSDARLAKPFSRAALQRKVDTLLGHSGRNVAHCASA